MRASPTLLVLALVAAACTDSVPSTSPAPSESTSTTEAPAGRPARCSEQLTATEVGRITDAVLNEISGAAVSRRRPGVIWVHNDSGSDATVYAISEAGDILQRVSLPALEARDWEDIAIGPGPIPDTDYLYLADIGDNQEAWESVWLHRIPEPVPGSTTVEGGETLRLSYPGGPTEAETLIVEPETGELVIVGKEISGSTALYAIPGTVDWSREQVATQVGVIELGTFAAVTGGDADEQRVLLRSYDEVFHWERTASTPLAETLLTPGCRIARVTERQGEAIALTGSGFYTLSEGIDQPINFYGPTP